MKYIYPLKIVLSEGTIENSQGLLKEKELQIGLSERDTAIVKGPAFLVFDFGKEYSGGIRILTYHVQGNKRVRLRFGESVTETCAELGEKNATNDHSLRDMAPELQDYSDMTFGGTGFRFLRLDVGEGTRLQLKSVVAASDADERKEIGSFECDDPLVNEIWNTAAYTLRLCLKNGYFWDGVKRDRLVWIGDLYPEMKAAACLYGNVSETENSLRFAREQTPLPEWINDIPMYSMWWLTVLCENFRLGGDRAFAEAQLPYAEGLLSLFEKNVDEEGNTLFGYNFIDWPTHYEPGGEPAKRLDELAGVNYLLRIALRKTQWLLREFGRDDGRCTRLIGKLSQSRRAAECYKQIAALGVWAGEKTEHNRALLLKGGAEGMSTFMSYEILSAAGSFGEYDAAMKMLKDYYGGMLSLGATTFWEDFDLRWKKNAARIDEIPGPGQKDVHGDYGAFCYKGFRHSFCHGWASGVIAYLSETVLGIRSEGIGFRKVRFEPHLSGLNYVKGVCPTPFGPVEAECRRTSDGRTEKHIRLPDGTTLLDESGKALSSATERFENCLKESR